MLIPWVIFTKLTELFMEFEAKIQQNDVSISVEKKSWEPLVFPSLKH